MEGRWTAGTQIQTGRESGRYAGTQAGSSPNSKHWFTTSFLQPLPYLVTP